MEIEENEFFNEQVGKGIDELIEEKINIVYDRYCRVGICNNFFCYRENKMVQIKKEEDDINMIIGLLYKDSC